jgi:2-dehydropantoate 2-reductase
MRIAIVGPGAVGLLIAGYLSKTDAAVTLVDQFPERAGLLNREGVRWEGADADFRFRVPVTVGLADPGGTDLVILCVKAYHTESAARELAAAGYRGPVMTLQNGAGNAELIAASMPGSAVIAGVTSEGANLAAQDHVRHAGRGKTSFGPMVAGSVPGKFLDDLAALMRAAGLDAELSADPLSLVWSKVLINAGINPLTAILGVRNGALLENEAARGLMAGLVREGAAVIKRLGMTPAYGDPVARAEEVCRLTAANFSSMYSDIKNGQQTEIDFINGALAREGAAQSVPCPLNSVITRIVHALESVL